MALEIDGLAILCAIAEAPQAFPAIRQEVNKVAQALVTKQLKAAGLTVAALRAVREALGSQPLALVVDGLKDAEVKTLVTRLDKHHPDLKTGKPADQRRHLLALASGTDPVPKPAKAPAAPRAARAKAPAADKAPAAEKSPARAAPKAPAHPLDSAAMAAVPPRRRRATS
jgi:hypothetical protein